LQVLCRHQAEGGLGCRQNHFLQGAKVACMHKVWESAYLAVFTCLVLKTLLGCKGFGVGGLGGGTWRMTNFYAAQTLDFCLKALIALCVVFYDLQVPR
jgi:hypothetical protein